MPMLKECLLAVLFSVALASNAAQAPAPVPTTGLVLWLDAADSSAMTLDAQNRLQRWSDTSG